MSKIYRVDVGFNDDTVIYELVPKEVARLKQATMGKVTDKLEVLNARYVLVDSGYPDAVEELWLQGFNVIKGRLPEGKS